MAFPFMGLGVDEGRRHFIIDRTLVGTVTTVKKIESRLKNPSPVLEEGFTIIAFFITSS
jgi:hypothetical protein